MIEHDIEIKNKLGLHARAAAKLVHTAARFRSDFDHIRSAVVNVDRHGALAIEGLRIKNMVRNHSLAKSISDSGWNQFLTIITIKANGDDEAEAVEAIEKLIDAKFDEVE